MEKALDTRYVRLCGGCNRTFACGTHGERRDAPFTCKECVAKAPAFDPKAGDVVTLAGDTSRRLVVISLEGADVVTQILGWPGQRTTYPLHMLAAAPGWR